MKRENMLLSILPFGNLDNSEFLTELVAKLSNYFDEVEVLPKVLVPKSSYNPNRKQYLADTLLKTSRTHCKDFLLGITEVDIYSPPLNFVFGVAELGGSVSVISVHRLKSTYTATDGGAPKEGRKSPGKNLFIDRVLKEATHEIGHTFGLEHCRRLHCVMHFSNTLKDTDIKTSEFCPDCEKKLKEEWRDILTTERRAGKPKTLPSIPQYHRKV